MDYLDFAIWDESELSIADSKNPKRLIIENILNVSIRGRSTYKLDNRFYNLTQKTIRENSLKLREPDFYNLRRFHRLISQSLHQKHEARKTVFEQQAYAILCKESRLEVFRSLWIGSHCVDLFIPSLAGNVVNLPEIALKGRGLNRFYGLVIEIDGPIHNSESKSKKDAHKLDFLQRLNIAAISIENQDLVTREIRKILALKSIKRLDHKSKIRMWRRIYLHTVAAHLPLEYFPDMIGHDFLPLFNQMVKAINKEGSMK